MNSLGKHIDKLDKYVKELKKEYESEKINQEQKRLLEIGQNLKDVLRVHKLKQEDLGFIIKRNISYISNRLNAKAEFTEEEQRIIKLHFKLDKDFFYTEGVEEKELTLDDLYVKYNKAQYELSNMGDYNKMNEELARLLYELLNELEEIL